MEKNIDIKKVVVPGETIVSGDNYLPGNFTRREGKDIVAERYGLVEIAEKIVKIIPLSGVFEPRVGNIVIGRVQDVSFNGWLIDIRTAYPAFLPLTECPRFVNKNDLGEFADVGDALILKIINVKRNSIELTLKGRGLRKISEGRIIKANSYKVPRIIGKGGSIINLIKRKTNTEIIVGQNGLIWIKGDYEGEKKAEEAIEIIDHESTLETLTEKIEKFLEG